MHIITFIYILCDRASRPPSDRLDPRRRAVDGKCERIEQWKRRLHQHIADIYDNTTTTTTSNSNSNSSNSIKTEGFNAQKWLEKFRQECVYINQCHTHLMSLRMRSEAALKSDLDLILTPIASNTATTTSAASISASTNSPSTTSSSETSNTELERLLSPSSNDSSGNDSDAPAVVVLVTDDTLAECYPHVPEPYRRVLYLLQKGMFSMYIYVRVPHSTILVTILIYT